MQVATAFMLAHQIANERINISSKMRHCRLGEIRGICTRDTSRYCRVNTVIMARTIAWEANKQTIVRQCQTVNGYYDCRRRISNTMPYHCTHKLWVPIETNMVWWSSGCSWILAGFNHNFDIQVNVYYFQIVYSSTSINMSYAVNRCSCVLN